MLTTRHPLSAKVGTTSPTNGGRSIGILRSRTKDTDFLFHMVPLLQLYVMEWDLKASCLVFLTSMRDRGVTLAQIL
jgi:hypothetical protein